MALGRRSCWRGVRGVGIPGVGVRLGALVVLIVAALVIDAWTVPMPAVETTASGAAAGPDPRELALPKGVEVCVAGPHARGAWPSCDGRQAKHPMNDHHGDGSRAAHQLADVFTPATLPAGMACHDQTAARRVLDLTCLHRVAGVYYHRLYDCVLRNFDWIEAAIAEDGPDALVLGQRPVLDVVLFLRDQPWQAAVRYGVRWSPADTFCVVLAEGTPVYYSSRQRPGPVRAQRLLALGLRERAYASARACMPASDSLQLEAAQPRPRILFIDRHRVRALDNADELLGRIALRLPRYELSTFHGNETLAETVCLFARAAAVVGVHGAGHVNVLFSRPGTAVLELGPMKTSGSDELWRSNVDVANAHGSLRWLTYALRHDPETLVDLRGRPGANVSLSNMQLQQLSAFHLPSVDMGNIVRILCAFLVTEPSS